jgi:predicted HTH transcriptional regulator
MKDSLAEYDKEFEDMVGNLGQTVQQMNDPVAIGVMLYSIAQEKNSTNLLIRDINAKFDQLLTKIENLQKEIGEVETRTKKGEAILSERDQEVLEFVKSKGKVDAQTLQNEYKYKGRNAASARLSKLFRDGHLEKTYSGRRVYYKTRD